MIIQNLRRCVIAVGVIFSTIAAADDSLPRSFYQLPEDHPDEDPAIWAQAAEEPSAEAGDRFNEILRSNTDVFERLANQTPFEMRRKWKLSQVELELSVNASGRMGVLVGKGSIGTKIYYRPQSSRGLADQAIDGAPADLTITSETTLAEVESQVEPIVRSIMATGKINNEANLRTTIRQQTTDFHQLMNGISSSRAYAWVFSRFRLDISLGASGMVHAGVFVGGVVRLRLEWVPTPTLQLAEPRVLTAEQTELQKFVNTIAAQADRVPKSTLGAHNFKLNQFNVALGMYGRFDIGMAKGQFAVRGFAYFNKQAPSLRQPPAPGEIQPAPYVKIIDSSPTAANLRYANDHRIPYVILQGTAANPRVVAYQLVADKISQGINRAAKMTHWILKISDRYGSRRWYPFQVQPEFIFSIEGNAGMVALGGQASLELTFNRP